MKKIIVLLSSIILLVSPVLVLTGQTGGTIPVSPNPGQWFRDIINRLLDIVVWPLFFLLSIIMFIWAGVLFLTAHGDPGKISTAQKAVLWAIVGVVVAIVGFSVTNIIKVILGV